MKFKREYLILGAVFLILLGILFFKGNDRKNYTVPELEKIAEKNIESVSVRGADIEFELIRKNSEWIIEKGGYKADKEKVEKALKHISGFSLGNMVSKSGDYHRYGLDLKEQVEVEIKGKGFKPLKFYMGKPASTYHHTFVKLTQKGEVYMGVGNFRDDIYMKKSEFRDKKVLSYENSAVSEINLSGIKSVKLLKTFTKPEDKKSKPVEIWMKGKEGADKKVVTDLLKELSDLKCSSYADKSTPAGDLLWKVDLKGAGADFLEIYRKSDKKDDKYLCTSSDSDYKFYLDQHNAEKIIDLIKKAAGIEDKEDKKK